MAHTYLSGRFYRKQRRFYLPTRSANATATGSTITPTISIVNGTATGGANATGATITPTISITSGTATGGAIAAGATITPVVSIVNGTATGTAAVSGQTVTVSRTITNGTPSGGAYAVTSSAIIDEWGQPLWDENGDYIYDGTADIAPTVSITSGTVTAGANASGATITVVVSVVAGAASGTSPVIATTPTTGAFYPTQAEIKRERKRRKRQIEARADLDRVARKAYAKATGEPEEPDEPEAVLSQGPESPPLSPSAPSAPSVDWAGTEGGMATLREALVVKERLDDLERQRLEDEDDEDLLLLLTA